ncbi:MAG: VOC family protein [Pseudomonadota bacterium]
MDQRVSIITLGVSDLASSIAFYERLGWRLSTPELTGVAFFQCPGIVFGLYPRAALAADAGLAEDGAGAGFGGFSLAYNTRAKEDVDALLAEATLAGARITKPAQDAFWGGYHGYFADPDGHLWEVAWNPGLVIEADGSARIMAPNA